MFPLTNKGRPILIIAIDLCHTTWNANIGKELKGMPIMRKLAFSLVAATFTGSAAFAGGMAEPVMEPVMAPVVVEEETGSSGGIVIPLLLLAVIAAVAASD